MALDVDTLQSPYESVLVNGGELGIGLPSRLPVEVQRWTGNLAETVDDARELYAQFGAVIISPEATLEGFDVNVGQSTQGLITDTVDVLRQHIRDPRIVKPKKYNAYNDTGRDMSTVAYPNVVEHFPNVMDFQHRLLSTIREVNDDPTTEASVDPDEGTVINLQLFSMQHEAALRRQHGAHTDRVDSTAVVCIDNVGPHGDLVFIRNYAEVCKQLGLDPHQNFPSNIKRIFREDPNIVTMLAHPVQRGSLVLVRTDADVHFITPKTLADVERGYQEGQDLTIIGGRAIGRAIINMAYETGDCRNVDNVARHIEKVSGVHDVKGQEFFDVLDKAVMELDPVLSDAVRNAIVTRRSADDLYG